MPTSIISGFGQLGEATGAQSVQGSSTLGKNEFVKLLMAQLGNQDPLAPQDNAAFVAQLAQFAQVELLQSTSATMDQLLLAQAAANQTQAATLIGKDISFRTDTVQLTPGEKVSLDAKLSADAKNVTWTIVDKSGKVVRTIRDTDVPAGHLSAEWDGLDDQGRALPPGTYRVRVAADDGDGQKLDVESVAQGHVDGVSFENGFAELLVDGRRVAMASVINLTEPSPSQDDAESGGADTGSDQ
jgi:flagellar basal-body rod modification protein FlgD